jgi:hypothetical protein
MWLPSDGIEGLFMPKRKIKPSHFSVTGYFPSAKNGGSRETESQLEQDFLLLLEFDRQVARYGVQPISIKWHTSEGHVRKYTPDVVVLYHTNFDTMMPIHFPTLYEVKSVSELRRNWHEMRPKYKAVMKWARENGFRFKFVTDTQIRTPYLENIRFLTRYSEHILTADDRLDPHRHLLLRETLKEIGISTPKALLHKISSDRHRRLELIPMLWQMMHIGVIQSDLTKPLNMSTPIWLRRLDQS